MLFQKYIIIILYVIYTNTHCKGRLKFQYIFILNDNSFENYDMKKIELINELNLKIEDNNYYISNKFNNKRRRYKKQQN